MFCGASGLTRNVSLLAHLQHSLLQITVVSNGQPVCKVSMCIGLTAASKVVNLDKMLHARAAQIPALQLKAQAVFHQPDPYPSVEVASWMQMARDSTMHMAYGRDVAY